MLNHTDDASTLMKKMSESANNIASLTGDLIAIGTDLNVIRGRFAEVKAKIKAEKEKLNALKVMIRAENNVSGGF